MVPNHYSTLDIAPSATQADIKKAYRRLVKRFHPDANREVDHDRITQINAAYEILGDEQRRRSYDQELLLKQYWGSDLEEQGDRQQRAAAAQRRYQSQRQTGQATDEHLQQWLNRVYTPVTRSISRILNSLQDEVDDLSADPFDDELMEVFQDYVETCRQQLRQAQQCFRSMPNPASAAGVAADLYHCLNQLGDGIEELNLFTLNYDDHYLHTGQELFRIAAGLRREAQAQVKTLR